MNDNQLRLAQRLMRLRRQREQMDRLAMSAGKAQQSQLTARLEHLVDEQAAQDRAMRARLLAGTRTATSDDVPSADATVMGGYRASHVEATARRAAIRRDLDAMKPQLNEAAGRLAESMARRKAAQLLLDRLTAQRAVRAAARQSREQDELRLARKVQQDD